MAWREGAGPLGRDEQEASVEFGGSRPGRSDAPGLSDGSPPGTFLGFDAASLRAIGAALLVIGIILLVAGIAVASSGPPMPNCTIGTPFEECKSLQDAWFQESTSRFMTGFALAAIGMVLMAVGGSALRFGLVKPVTSYVAAEASPAVEIASAAIARGLRDARASQLTTPPTSLAVRVKCRACGYLETEDAEFCSKCGQRI